MFDHARPTQARGALPLFVVLAAALTIGSDGALAAPATAIPSTIPQPSLARFKTPLPVAPLARRVDVAMPRFSNPTMITNPLFPISDLHSAVLLGSLDQQPFRTETTLLPDTRTIEWMGQKIEVRRSQYMAYLGGRIEEVALDLYGQADDGSVWYFGEDVYNYADGAIADREGTWMAPEDGPPAMIMPGRPRVGDVFRPENAPGFVFEEVTVNAVDTTVDGPRGSVRGVIATRELHMDGTSEVKLFAPGYGEFRTGDSHDLEALALAVPTDALPGPVPAELRTIAGGAEAVYDAARTANWAAAAKTFGEMNAAWQAYRTRGSVPPLLDVAMSRALESLRGDALAPALEQRHAGGVQRASTTVALAALDLQLRHRTPREIDRERFLAWTRQLAYDAEGEQAGAVAGDVTTLEWIRDRFAHLLASADAARINGILAELRAIADAETPGKAAPLAARLRETAAGLRLAASAHEQEATK